MAPAVPQLIPGIIGCCCSACGDLSLKRQRVKRLISEFEIEHPDVKQSMIAALGRVVPSHLLDPHVMDTRGERPRGAAVDAGAVAGS